jgi:citronellyl-CoA dehydrogenase
MWITNSLQADWMCVLANTSQGKPHMNKSLIIVPMNEPGVVKVKETTTYCFADLQYTKI